MVDDQYELKQNVTYNKKKNLKTLWGICLHKPLRGSAMGTL